MKRDEFRTFVKEVIKEVMNEMNEEDAPATDDVPMDDPKYGNPKPVSSKTDKAWRGKMRWREKNIENDPNLQAKLAAKRDAERGIDPRIRKTEKPEVKPWVGGPPDEK